MVKDPKRCLVQGHPDNEAKIMALKPAESKFNVSLTTTELWRQRYELPWPTSVRHQKLLNLQWESGQGPVALSVLWPGSCSIHPLGSAALLRGTRLVFLSNIDFLNIRWNGWVLQKKKEKRINCHIQREIQFIVLRRWGWEGTWQGPKGTVISGNWQGPQYGYSPPGFINSSCQSHGHDWTQNTDSF